MTVVMRYYHAKLNKDCAVNYQNLEARTVGVVLVVVSAVVFSSAGIFTKWVPTPAWDIIFWRGVSAASFTLIYLTFRGNLVREIRIFGKPALLVTIMMGLGTAAFIPAFKLSNVANVALIYGAAPFAAAGLTWVFIKELPTRTVLLASIAAFTGVVIVVSGSLGSSRVQGDMLAMFMTLMMAGTMVVYRKYPSTTAALPAALSSLLLLPLAFAFGEPLSVPTTDLPVLLCFGLVFAVASVTLSEGARRLPPAETALLSTLEMPLAPILALLILSEVPTPAMLLGGAIILAAVVWSQRQPQSRL